MRSFGEHLAALLRERNWSRRRFARLTGTSSSYIDFIVAGRRNPPKRTAVLERWAEVLKLSPPERRHLLDLADLSRTPSTVRKRMHQLEDENRELRDQLAELRRRTGGDPEPS